MQPREWAMLALLILVPLVIAGVVTLWSIKQMAYAPGKRAAPKPVLSPDEVALLGGQDREAAFGSAAEGVGDAGAAAVSGAGEHEVGVMDRRDGAAV